MYRTLSEILQIEFLLHILQIQFSNLSAAIAYTYIAIPYIAFFPVTVETKKKKKEKPSAYHFAIVL